MGERVLGKLLPLFVLFEFREVNGTWYFGTCYLPVASCTDTKEFK